MQIVFKLVGYQTACIGKWHLGMDMPVKEISGNTKFKLNSEQSVKNGPNENGFDYFYGISASLDFPPYVFIENRGFVGITNDTIAQSYFPKYARAGERDPNFYLEDCLDEITNKAIAYIQEQAQKPFFLYFPLTAPHKPVLPHERFRGRTNLGQYGDFLTQVDWTVGQILKELDKQGIADNTIVILTSDNGSFMKRIGADSKFPFGRLGHVKDNKVQSFNPENHQPNHIFRGTKTDIWEGGHRVPFLVRWPDQIKKGTKSDKTISLTDFFATALDITNGKHDKALEGEDSFSFLPLLKQSKNYTREPVIHHSISGMFSIRKGSWKLVLGNGSGERQVPAGKAFKGPYQLYSLEKDIQEENDVAYQNYSLVNELLTSFDEIYNRTEKIKNHPTCNQ